MNGAQRQGLLQGWNSLLVQPGIAADKDIKVQVNKQKPNNVGPVRMKHNSDKCPLLQCRACSKPDVACCPVTNLDFLLNQYTGDTYKQIAQCRSILFSLFDLSTQLSLSQSCQIFPFQFERVHQVDQSVFL